MTLQVSPVPCGHHIATNALHGRNHTILSIPNSHQALTIKCWLCVSSCPRSFDADLKIVLDSSIDFCQGIEIVIEFHAQFFVIIWYRLQEHECRIHLSHQVCAAYRQVVVFGIGQKRLRFGHTVLQLSCRHVKLSRIVADSSAFAEVRHVEAGAMAGTSARNSSNDCNADVPALQNATSSCKLKRTRFSGGGATVPVHPLSSWRAVASPVRMPAVALDAAPVASNETLEAS